MNNETQYWLSLLAIIIGSVLLGIASAHRFNYGRAYRRGWRDGVDETFDNEAAVLDKILDAEEVS